MSWFWSCDLRYLEHTLGFRFKNDRGHGSLADKVAIIDEDAGAQA